MGKVEGRKMTPQSFILYICNAARDCQKATKIPASFTIAQAAVESGWGARTPGNNLFGIKADKSWHGDVIPVPTHEVIDGVRKAVTCNFRKYLSWGDSINDHAKFLTENPRYHAAFLCDNAIDFTKAIASVA